MSSLMRKYPEFSKARGKIWKLGNKVLSLSRDPAPLCLIFVCICAVVVCLLGYIALALFLTDRRKKMSIYSGTASNESHLLQQEQNVRPRGIVMSCPFGQSQNHRGNWKPRRMVQGVEAVIQQLHKFDSSLPLFFGHYETEKLRTQPWCRNVSDLYAGQVGVFCFMV